MLKAEAHWIGEVLDRLNVSSISPFLNVGSATAEFRERLQPWIHQQIFASLQKRGVVVDHLDIQEGPGIDLHGNLYDDGFLTQLRDREYSGTRLLQCIGACCLSGDHHRETRAIGTGGRIFGNHCP